MRGRCLLATPLLCGLLLAACARSPLFFSNSRLRIVTPAELATVTLPVHLSWRVKDLPTAAVRYAVFVDPGHAAPEPIHPGQNLRAVASNDKACLHARGCPDAAYLEAHDIFLTNTQSVTIAYVSDLGGLEKRDPLAVHQATLILISLRGYRVGEYAYTVQFRISKASQSR